MPRKKSAPAPTSLKGWKAIAGYLGLTPATAQRWAEDGMPVKREGRFTVADPAELQAWLGRESHMAKPAHVMTKDADISAALKESLAATKREKKNSESGSR
ncbi:MAG TPA: hypothetical protein VFB76_18610 [Candidatus Angelobacter sp.]|nr:hypothetical protein [Candidatus Angelobacter sp.]